jgi:hypothetical protein
MVRPVTFDTTGSGLGPVLGVVVVVFVVVSPVQAIQTTSAATKIHRIDASVAPSSDGVKCG